MVAQTVQNHLMSQYDNTHKTDIKDEVNEFMKEQNSSEEESYERTDERTPHQIAQSLK